MIEFHVVESLPYYMWCGDAEKERETELYEVFSLH